MVHNRLGSFSAFFLRRFVASIIAIIVPIIVIAVIYVVLFLMAIIGNLPLGSPVFLPLSVTAIFVISMLYTTLFLFPSVWFSEMVSWRFDWHPLTQILLSTGTLFVLVHLVLGVLQLLPDYERLWWLYFANHPLVISLALCLPLGLYWWSAKTIELSTWGVSSWWKMLLSWRKARLSEGDNFSLKV